MKEKISDQQMIELLKKKDKKAIQQIYELYSPTLLAICMRYFKQRELALDVMHEGFMKALNSIQSFNSQGSFEGWLKRIIVNHSLDTLKKEKKYQTQDIEEVQLIQEDTNNESKAIDKKDIDENTLDVGLVRDAEFTCNDILEEIHKLPEMYCIVFVLFVLEKFSHAEIAQKLEIDEKTSRTRLARARKMIKEALYKRSISILGR
ncbi:MAG: sigma-70 family RNA polymerase sigma factor [Cytophagales bacterium]|nr:sigma-70 family RNA polymerase sigma factor [Cytophagales bacterium]